MAKSMRDKDALRPEDTKAQGDQHVAEHIHEGSDVDVRPIAKFMAILFVGVGVVMVVLWGVFGLLEKRAERADKPRSPVFDSVRVLKEPKLQSDPIADLRAFRRGQDSVMNSYGWVDSARGIVRVPISEAIEMLARQGLPARAEQPAPDTATVLTESGVLIRGSH